MHDHRACAWMLTQGGRRAGVHELHLHRPLQAHARARLPQQEGDRGWLTSLAYAPLPRPQLVQAQVLERVLGQEVHTLVAAAPVQQPWLRQGPAQGRR